MRKQKGWGHEISMEGCNYEAQQEKILSQLVTTHIEYSPIRD